MTLSRHASAAKLIAGAAILAALVANLGSPLHSSRVQVASAAGRGTCAGVSIRFFAGGNAGDAFASIVYRGAEAAASDLGANVQYVFNGWDVEKMTNSLRDAVAAHPDGIAMMGHPGDAAIMPLAKKAHDAGILMEYQNVDLPKVRAAYGGGYVGSNLIGQGTQLAELALKEFKLSKGDRAIVFGAWGQPGRYFREDATAKTLMKAGLVVQEIVVPTTVTDPSQLTPMVAGAFLSHPETKLIVYPGGQLLGEVPQYMQAIHKTAGQINNIGFDTSPQVIAAFQQGYVQLTMDQEPFLQGYIPIVSLCMEKKFGLSPISLDTSNGYVDTSNYQSIAAMAKAGYR